MSQENVEFARRAVDSLNRGDADAFLEAMADDIQADWSNSHGPQKGWLDPGANIRSMGDAGHPYAQFRRALERGSLTAILSAAAGLERIELSDALAVCAVVARQEPAEFDRYAVRWIAAAIKEREAVDLPFLMAAIAALERLRRDGDAAEAERALGLRF